eukprot:scaffold127488_cov44-Attheya_sp.AAC.4
MSRHIWQMRRELLANAPRPAGKCAANSLQNAVTHLFNSLAFEPWIVQLESPAASDQKDKEFLRKIQEILSCPLPAYEAPSFEFRMDTSAAATNWKILQQHNGALKQALAPQSRSQLGYGSEF